MQPLFTWTAIASILMHAAIVGGLSLRVLAKRKPIGVSTSWIVLLISFPIFGAFMYVLVGETWLSGRRTKRTALAARKLEGPIRALDKRFGAVLDDHHPAAEAIARIGRTTGMSAPLGGNDIEILGNANACFDRLLEDIESAERSCDLLYYIWFSAGRVQEVENALIRAHERGVTCRVLVDAVGSKSFLRHDSAQRLRDAGVQVRASLPVNLLRASLHRVDIRNHRKLAVFDDKVAHIGSLNMADPKFFMKNEGFGQWVDLAARVTGPAAATLGDLFEADWAMDTDDPFKSEINPKETDRTGTQIVQVVPSGPGQQPKALFHILSAAVFGAQRSLTLTTPYFIPDDAFVTGLIGAALRGVDVNVVVPAKVNGPLVRYASMAYYDDLIEAGVNVHLYDRGLLHAKTITVDDEIAIIGTVNIDRRSFWLNYELSLVVHGSEATESLRALQNQYIAQSTPLTESPWMRRSPVQKLAEQAAQLLSPIL